MMYQFRQFESNVIIKDSEGFAVQARFMAHDHGIDENGVYFVDGLTVPFSANISSRHERIEMPAVTRRLPNGSYDNGDYTQVLHG